MRLALRGDSRPIACCGWRSSARSSCGRSRPWCRRRSSPTTRRQLGLENWQSGLPLAALGDRHRRWVACWPASSRRRRSSMACCRLGALGLTLERAGLCPDRAAACRARSWCMIVAGDLQRDAVCAAQRALAMARAGRPARRGHRDGERAGLRRHGPRHVPGAGAGPRGLSRRARRFWASSIVLGGGFLWALSLVPDAFLRFLLLGLAHTIYRVRIVGRSNVPSTGGALLVPNHVTFADGLFVIAATDRPVRFVVYADVLREAVHRLGAAVDEGDPDRGQRRPEDDLAGLSRGRQGTRRRASSSACFPRGSSRGRA